MYPNKNQNGRWRLELLTDHELNHRSTMRLALVSRGHAYILSHIL